MGGRRPGPYGAVRRSRAEIPARCRGDPPPGKGECPQIAHQAHEAPAASPPPTGSAESHAAGRRRTVRNDSFDAGDTSTPFGGSKSSSPGHDTSLSALDGHPVLKTTWIGLV
ncbi:Aldehyde dehydrogenase family protein (plasmid) [Streptomyces clavuligerus]|uniref:Aldehyde dehydrogenase family protein n=1 Tax=Streptomyces clavuligerus TaxID=1901 RepID=D5SKN9_STRCL|nr:Aldehyde dehydrogenase family protein [Streptomyces clavuligerus]